MFIFLSQCYRNGCYSRHYSSSKPVSPMKLLDQLHSLAEAVNQTQSVVEKRVILQQYPSCQSILKRIYDPHRRHFVSSKTAFAYMEKRQQELEKLSSNKVTTAEPIATRIYQGDQHIPFTSLESLLDALASRQLRGHAALDAISWFYSRYCTTTVQQQTFWRILDRDLKMGVSIQTVRRLLSSKNNGDKEKDNNDNIISQASTVYPSVPSSATQSFYDRRFMNISLATTMQPGDEEKLWNHAAKEGPYYVSRKLDGVRCITLVQFLDHGLPHITFCSRTGRLFDSLEKVESAIRQQLDSLKKQQQHIDFVLDGEICVYPTQPDTYINGDDVDDVRKEDFLETIRQVRTAKRQMEHPVYQIFDLINMDVFRQGKGGPLFDQRQQQLRDMFGSYTGDYLKVLKQTPVMCKDQLMDMEQKVGRFGWEGLILRKNIPYEGKRSRNMLKIKEWEDAEYNVESIETGLMRMPGTGQQKQVMTNVVINHKGNAVSVGSGFSLQQRLDYANNPQLILGKLITVQYFSESLGDSGNLSLRFPSVKAVYDGDRD
ncbi:uncharacterized protein BX664DRAFT_322724 [Halteromyces radiatus]|uniref:uncharacterized protein n=1 Tax=Halteromyces radiatus TaxID=101107 RepID=UPI00221FEF72|nr:uncharacterized protein BX664DRAFT_322724 [Halteromyces radiatus]KAI8100042.1 hypothetical protein BX664DRAFT_322724 [Halteromyces radiatus]